MKEYIIIYLLAVNIVAFFLYGLDKQKARMNRWRISEKALLMAAVVGGSVGAYAGMKMFSHKTKKPKFYLGVPVIILLQTALGIFLAVKLS